MIKNKKIFNNLSKTNIKIINDYLKYKTNAKPVSKPRNLISPIRALANYLNKKSLKNATEKDLMYFLNPKNNLVSINTRNLYYGHLKRFYRWLYKLDRQTIPNLLKWYEPITKQTRNRYLDPNRREKHLITEEDYINIIKLSNDSYGQDKAIWETYYLSGIRPEELPTLLIEHIQEHPNGNYEITIDIENSKSMPRKIPLPERPDNLIRWLGNHPDRDNKKSPLWISYKSKGLIKPIDENTIAKRFRTLKKNSNGKIKQSLTIESFRKNRATIMFNEKIKSKDGKLIPKYTDGEIAQFFGWQPHTVAQRRIDYEISDPNTLRKVIWENPQISINYDTLTKDLEKLRKENKELRKLKDFSKDIKSLRKIIITLANSINPYYEESPIGYYGNCRWIITKDNKYQLTYLDTNKGTIKAYKQPITKIEYLKNNIQYQSDLAKYLYENKLTKKIIWTDKNTFVLEE